jgi:hypothetical protein
MPFKVKNRKKLKVAVYCLLTAATFWFFNTMGNRYVTDVHFPVKYKHPDSLTVEQSVDYIIVSVSGTGWNILNNQLGFKIDPVEITLKESGRYEIKTVEYTTFIRSQLDGIEMKQIITEQLDCKLIKTND